VLLTFRLGPDQGQQQKDLIMKECEPSNVALSQVAPGRRGFLQKMLTGGVAVAALPAMSTVVLGKDDAQGGAKGKGKAGGAAKGKGKGGAGAMDPAARAKMMIEKFDVDQDGKLSLEELTKMFETMAQRGGAGKGKGKGGAQGKGKAGAGEKGKGKGKADKVAN